MLVVACGGQLGGRICPTSSTGDVHVDELGRLGRWRQNALAAIKDTIFLGLAEIALKVRSPLDHCLHWMQKHNQEHNVETEDPSTAYSSWAQLVLGKAEELASEFTDLFALRRWRGFFSRAKNQPKEEVFGTDIPRTSGAHSRGYPGPNFGQGGQNPGKTSISARTSMTRRRGRPRP